MSTFKETTCVNLCLFSLPLGVIGRLWSTIMALPGHHLY